MSIGSTSGLSSILASSALSLRAGCESSCEVEFSSWVSVTDDGGYLSGLISYEFFEKAFFGHPQFLQLHICAGLSIERNREREKKTREEK